VPLGGPGAGVAAAVDNVAEGVAGLLVAGPAERNAVVVPAVTRPHRPCPPAVTALLTALSERSRPGRPAGTPRLDCGSLGGLSRPVSAAERQAVGVDPHAPAMSHCHGLGFEQYEAPRGSREAVASPIGGPSSSSLLRSTTNYLAATPPRATSRSGSSPPSDTCFARGKIRAFDRGSGAMSYPCPTPVASDKSDYRRFDNPLCDGLTECPRGDLNPLDHPLEAQQTREVQRFGEFTAAFPGHRGTPRGGLGTTGRTCPTRFGPGRGDRLVGGCTRTRLLSDG
jgi:hypothetical protein